MFQRHGGHTIGKPDRRGDLPGCGLPPGEGGEGSVSPVTAAWLRRLRHDAAGDVLAAFTSNPDMARQGEVATLDDADRYVANLLQRGPAHEPWGVADADGLLGLVCITVDERNRSGWFWYW